MLRGAAFERWRQRPAWLFCLIICIMQGQVQAGPPYLSPLLPTSIQANNQTCLYDEDCSDYRFCSHPPFSFSRGHCTQCWRCCLFPALWGACPDRCNCVVGQQCSSAAECGQGMFCAAQADNTTFISRCQLCSTCLQDSQDVSGSCAADCASAALSAQGFTTANSSAAQAHIFLSFLATEVDPDHAQSAATGQLSAASLWAWLEWEGLNAVKANNVMGALTGSQQGKDISVEHFVDVLSRHDSHTFMCPTLDQLPLAEMVPQGCACNATESAATFKCTAGYRCSRVAYQSLSSDALMEPTAARMRAVCVPCQLAQYCPAGTYIEDEVAGLSKLDCPASFYCPTPANQLPCPPGSYCVARTVAPISCDYEYLIQSQPFAGMPMEPLSVLQRLRDNEDPHKGNYCPVSSVKPNEVCSGGYYCPNASAAILCPAGHMCKAQSVAPRKCSMLTHCPEGTSMPRWSALAFVILSMVVASLPLTYWSLSRFDGSSIRYEDLDRLELLQRNRTAKATIRLLQSIRSRGRNGGAGSFTDMQQADTTPTKYAGFGQVEPRIRLNFEQLGLRLPGKGRVLEGVSGFFPPGKMSAVMGPSGSGKTTFLNVLCGKAVGTVTGRVFVNGQALPIDQTHRITGFVPQDDIVHEDLTVKENLEFAAHLKLPRDSVDAGRRRAVIEDAIEMLQLQRIQHYRVGSVEKRGISGGQRKRVNIGIELVGSPSVLFLDEPTSGLDATASNDILKSLADMASLGMTVVAVIHQPRFSSFMLFDQVLLLGHGGSTVFIGPPGVAVLYFQVGLGFHLPPRENPADVLMDIIAGKVQRQGDMGFKPSQLAEWWLGNGEPWVDEFERLNEGHQGDVVTVEPDMIEAMEAEFDRVARACNGLVRVDGLIEVFDGLGYHLSMEDAELLMAQMATGNADAAAGVPTHKIDSSANGADGIVQGQASGKDDMVIAREQLVGLFQSMTERTKTAGRIEAMERYQSDQTTFAYPDIDITAMCAASTAVASLAATPSVLSMPAHLHLINAAGSMVGSTAASGPGTGDASPGGLHSPVRKLPLLCSKGGSKADPESPHNRTPGSNAGDWYLPADPPGQILPTGNSAPGIAGLPVQSNMPGSPVATGQNVRSQAAGMLGSAGNSLQHQEPQAAAEHSAGGGVPLGEAVDRPSRLSAHATAFAAPSVGIGPCLQGWLSLLDSAVPYKEELQHAQLTPVQPFSTPAAQQQVSDGLAVSIVGPSLPERLYRHASRSINKIHPQTSGHAGAPTPTSSPRQDALSVQPWTSYTPNDGVGGIQHSHGALQQQLSSQMHSPYLQLPPALVRLQRTAAPYSAGGALPERDPETSAGNSWTWSRSAAGAYCHRTAVPSAVSGFHGHRSGAHAAAAASPSKTCPQSVQSVEPFGCGFLGIHGLLSKSSSPRSPINTSPRYSAHSSRASPPAGIPALFHAGGEAATYTSTIDQLLEGQVNSMQLHPKVLAGPPIAASPRLLSSEHSSINSAASTLHTGLAATVAEATDVAATSDSSPVVVSLRGNEICHEQAGCVPDGVLAEPRVIVSEAMEQQPNPFAQLASMAELCKDMLPMETSSLAASFAETWRLGLELSMHLHSQDSLEAVQGSSHLHAIVSMPAAVDSGPSWHLPYSSRGTLQPPASKQAGPVAEALDRAMPISSGTLPSSTTPAASPLRASSIRSPRDPRPSPSNPEPSASTVPRHYRDVLPGKQDSPQDRVAHGRLRDGEGGTSPLSHVSSSVHVLRTDSTDFQGPASATQSVTRNSPQHAGAGPQQGSLYHSVLSRLRYGGNTRPHDRFMEPVGTIVHRNGTASLENSPSHISASGLRRTASTGGGSSTSHTPITPHERKYVDKLLQGVVATHASRSQLPSPTHRTNSSKVVRQRLGLSPTMAQLRACQSASGYIPPSPPSTLPQRIMSALGVGNVPIQPEMSGKSVARFVEAQVAAAAEGLKDKQALLQMLQERSYPGFLIQFQLLLHRGSIKYMRCFWPLRVMDVLLLLAASFIIGFIHGPGWSLGSVPSNAVMTMTCLGILSMVTHLRTFSQNRLLLWRETASGIGMPAHFLAANTMDSMWILLAPALFLGPYYYITLPRMAWSTYYCVGLLVCWWASGTAYLASALLHPSTVLMAGVFLALILGAFLQGLTPTIASARGTFLQVLMGVSYNRWAMEVLTIKEFSNYQDNSLNIMIMIAKGVGICGVDTLLVDDGQPGLSTQEAISFLSLQENFSFDSCQPHLNTAYASLVGLGAGTRLLAYLLLRFKPKKQY